MADQNKPLFSQVTTELPRPHIEEIAPPEPPPETAPKKTRPPQRARVWIAAAAAAVVLVALVLWVISGRRRAANEASSTQVQRTAKVERRDFVRVLRLTGTVEAVQSYTVAAPRLAGQQIFQLTITKLTPSGSKVKKGDLLVEFDRQDQIKNSMDRKAEYLDFVGQIKKKQADQDAARARDDTELKQAEDALETAKLEMRKNEVVSRIDAEKNQENLDQAEANLKQLRATYELKRRAAAADLKILEIQRDRSHDSMLFADRNAELMAIHALLDGLVVLNNIWMGGQMRAVQEGDQVRPGVPFMQVVNPQTMQVRARVNQADIRYLRLGQPVEVRLDAYPEMAMKGGLDQIAAIGTQSELSDRVHTFAVLVSIRGADPKLMPDLSAAVDVELERRPNSLVVPRDAVFQDSNQSFVHVKRLTGYEKRAVRTGEMSDVDAVIDSGVDAGAEVLRGGAG